MNGFSVKLKKIIAAACLVTCLIVLVWMTSIFFGKKSTTKQQSSNRPKDGMIIEEHFFIPETGSIGLNDGSVVGRGVYNTKLVPKSSDEKIIVPTAKLSLKQSYELALPEALKWSGDAKLVFIKSLGVLTLEGRTGEWQLIFSSVVKKMGYEVIIEEDKVVAQKEISTSAAGIVLPQNWYDSDQAIVSLQYLPQFNNDTISSISFYFNSKQQLWSYGLATSGGQKTTSMWVK